MPMLVLQQQLLVFGHRQDATAASATAWCNESTSTDALLGLVTLSVAIILHFG